MITSIEKLKEKFKIHNDYYQYDFNTYKNLSTRMKIICKIHGEFWQSPHNHEWGKGCVFCGRKRIDINTLKDRQENFITKATLLYGNRFNLSTVNYIDNRQKVKIICKEHGEFSIIPSNFLQDTSCKKCNSSNRGHYCTTLFDREPELKIKKGQFYILNFKNYKEEFIKIGVSNNINHKVCEFYNL
jgi:hypothetical protein